MAHPPRATPASPAESRCPLRSDLLIGRGDELEALAASLARPAHGVVVVEGEPGIGKSRLVEEALAGVEGRETYRVSASWASAVPLSPWAELLRAMARSRGHPAAVAAAGGAAAVLAGLVPELGPAGTASGPRAADLVPWFFARLLDGAPAVVVLEDAHEADPLSLDVLRRTAAQADPVLWIITAREASDGPWAQARTELIRGEAAHHVLLGPLAPVEMRALVEHLAGSDLDEAQAVRCAELSAGNPFLAEELVAATRRGGAPAEAAGAVSGRLEALGPAARQAARAAAVYGAPVAHGQLRELTGFGEHELLDAVREAVAAGVLEATADGCYSLRHALVGEAARAELLPVERARLHAAVARLLEEDAHAHARADAPAPAALAAAAGHWEAAGRLDLAQPAHAAAADAVRVLDPRAAAAHYRRAVELAGEAPEAVLDAGWLERGASCAAAAGDHAGAVALARRALDLPGLPALQESRLTLLLAVHGSEELADGEVGAAHERAIALAGGERTRRASPELAAAMAAYGRYWLVLDRNGEALRWASRAVQIAERAGAEGELALARGTAGASGCYLGSFADGLPQLREAVDGLERSGRPYDSARAGLTLAWAEFHAGEVDQALLTVAAQLAAVEERGGPQDIGASLAAAADEMHVWLGWWPLVDPEPHRRGRLPAVDSAGAALRRATRAELALRRGDLAAARTQYAEVLAYWESLGLGDFDLASLARLAEIAAEEGDWGAARRHIRRALPGLAETDTWVSVASLARAGVAVEAAAARAGQAPDSALAEALQVELGRAVQAGGLPAGSLAAAECATARADLARLTGREDPQAWRAAAEAWAALGFPWWRAMAELRQAEGVLARNGSRGEAAPLVERARQAAESLGAGRLAAWADGLLRRGGLAGLADRSASGPLSGVPSPRGAERETAAEPADGPLAALTAREHEVLGLLAEGCSNRKIAETLFISEKTASVHVSHILTKLGVASRLEAAALAHRAQGVAGQP